MGGKFFSLLMFMNLAEPIPRDAIKMDGCFKEDEKQLVPIARAIDKVSMVQGGILALVDVDFDEYWRKT